MAGFQYFIKCPRSADIRSEILKTDLKEYAPDLAGTVYTNLEGGGYAFSFTGKDKDVLIGIRDNQTVTDFDGYKVIIDNEKPPKPADFAKDDALNGYPVELGDGNEWIVPMARHFDEGSVLPSAICINSFGEYVLQPIEKLLTLNEIAEKVMEDILITLGQFEGDKNYTQIPEIFKACTKILQTNYNLSEVEISILQLIRTDNYNLITQSLVDWQFAKQMLEESTEGDEKKTQDLLRKELSSVNL